MALPRLSHKWTTLGVVATSVFTATLDASAIAVSLPNLAVEFGASFDTLQWVVLGYLLVITGMLLPIGRAADALGRRRIFLGGLAVFVVGSLLAGLSVGIWMLIGFRVLQALGGAATQAIGAALVIDAFPGHERGRAMGLVLAAVSAGLVAGPIAGGLLTATIGWRWIFFINVPVGIMSLALGWRTLPVSVTAGPRKFDFAGSILLLVGLVLLLFGLNRVQVAGISSPSASAPLCIGIVLMLLFVWWQQRTPTPIVTLEMFRVREFSAATLASFITFLGLSSLVLLLPFFLQRGIGLTAFEGGLVMATIPLLMGIAGPVAGAVADRLGTRPVASAGLGLTVAGLGFMATLPDSTGPIDIVLRLIVVGIGLGLFNSANASSLMGAAAQQHRGQASAVMALARNTGQAVGQALWGTLWVVIATSILGVTTIVDQPLDAAFDAFRMTWTVAAMVAGIALIASEARGRTKPLCGHGNSISPLPHN